MTGRARTLLVAAAVAVAASPAAAAKAAPAPGDPALIAACVAANQARYDVPANAVLTQYISLLAACRAGLTHETDVHVSLTPVGHVAGKSAGKASTQPPSEVQPPAELPHLLAPPPSKSGTTTAGKPGGTVQVHAPVAPHATQKHAVAAVTASIRHTRHRGVAVAGASSGPPWLLILLGVTVVAAGSAAVLGFRRR